MKKALLVLTLLVSPGVFSATPTSNSDPLMTAARKKHKAKKKKKAPSAQNQAPASSSPSGSSADQSGSNTASRDYQGLSGNAVPTAEENARQSRLNEERNNVNFGSGETSKGSNASTVYPRSADPDVRDSYESGGIHGNQKTRDREASTGSTVLDSFSGSSSLPPDQKQGKESPTQ